MVSTATAVVQADGVHPVPVPVADDRPDLGSRRSACRPRCSWALSPAVGSVVGMALATAKRMTAAEFHELPEQRHRELINGEVVVNEPSVRHQRIAGRLFARLAVFAEAHPGVGEAGLAVDTPIDEHNVFGPDLWWTTPGRTPGWDASGHAGVPDIAVEVRSPSTWRHDVGAKRGHYEWAGLPELWLVDTVAETIIVLRRSLPEVSEFDQSLEVGAGDTLTTPIIPGFELDVGALFLR